MYLYLKEFTEFPFTIFNVVETGFNNECASSNINKFVFEKVLNLFKIFSSVFSKVKLTKFSFYLSSVIIHIFFFNSKKLFVLKSHSINMSLLSQIK